MKLAEPIWDMNIHPITMYQSKVPSLKRQKEYKKQREERLKHTK